VTGAFRATSTIALIESPPLSLPDSPVRNRRAHHEGESRPWPRAAAFRTAQHPSPTRCQRVSHAATSDECRDVLLPSLQSDSTYSLHDSVDLSSSVPGESHELAAKGFSRDT
jgi:hypothetical protein